MYQVFNMGIGMVIVCSGRQVARVVDVLPQAKVIGEINKGKDKKVIID
jgi:phosphoribosylaminoimidazole (AIR) synthetase